MVTNLRTKWLLVYKISTFALVTSMVWGVSPLVAKDAFRLSFPEIIPRIWLTLIWATGLASFFDMKTQLRYWKACYPRHRLFNYVLGFAGALGFAVTILVISSFEIQLWFGLRFELAALISATLTIIVVSKMAKVSFEIYNELENRA